MSDIVEIMAMAAYEADPDEEEWQGVGHEPAIIPWDELTTEEKAACVAVQQAALTALEEKGYVVEPTTLRVELTNRAFYHGVDGDELTANKSIVHIVDAIFRAGYEASGARL